MDNDVQAVNTANEVSSNVSVKTFTQEELNHHIGREKAAAYEKARRDVEAQYAVKSSGNSEAPSFNTEEVIAEAERRITAKFQQEQEKHLELQQKAAWDGVVKDYNKKLADTAASNEYEDFDDTIRGFNHAKYNTVIGKATELPNTGDIMYELAKKPAKAVNLELLAQHDYAAFEKEMDKLSKSITANKEAQKKVSKASEPIARLKPSVTGAESADSDDYLALKRKYRG